MDVARGGQGRSIEGIDAVTETTSGEWFSYPVCFFFPNQGNNHLRTRRKTFGWSTLGLFTAGEGEGDTMGVGANASTTSVFEVFVGVEGRLCGEGDGVAIDDGVEGAATITGSLLIVG